MDLPQLDGVTHRTVAARGLRFHVAEAGAGDADRAPARLAAALVDVAPPRAAPRAARAAGHARPARLRLVRRAARRLRQADHGRRRPRRPRRARAASGCASSATTGAAWIGFLACAAAPERFAAFLALGAPRPLGTPAARQLLQIWRFAYQVVLAAPLLGRRLVRRRALHGPPDRRDRRAPRGVDRRRRAGVHRGADRARARAGERGCSTAPSCCARSGAPRAGAWRCRRGS